MIEFVILLIVSVGDAYRDRWVYRRVDVSWWQWHLVKWVSFYGLAGYVFFNADFRPLIGFLTILLCWAVWNGVYWFGRVEFEHESRKTATTGELEFRTRFLFRDRM